DWSDQAEEGPNYALMAYLSSSSNSEVLNDSNCSKSCLESVEDKLKFYKKIKSVYVQNINGLKWDIQVGEITIRELRKKLEKIQKEKDSIQITVDKFKSASKSLDKLIECQIVDNYKKGLGYEKYNAVPPPYTRNFMPPTPDLSFTGLDEFVNKPVVSNSEEENVSQPKTKKKKVKPSIAKIEFVKPKQHEKTARKTVKQAEKHRQNTHIPRGNQKIWNNMMSQKLGRNFEMFHKACYVCGSFDHLFTWVFFLATKDETSGILKSFITEIENLVDHKIKTLIVELTDRTVKYPKGIAKNVLVEIGKFVFPVDVIILDMLENIKVPLILKRPFLSTAMLRLMFQRKLTLEVGGVRLKERLWCYNRSLGPLFGDYIEQNDLNVPVELRRDQVDDLMPTIEECEVVEEFRARNDARMVSKIFGYPSDCDHDKKIRIDCAQNLKFSCMIDFAVLEYMEAYRDEEMGDVIFG
ncbi:hypothetical protein Tco_1275652, partial [Tanacetum coccineum]